MGAVFGFTGAPDRPLVDKMKAVMNHRGRTAFFFREYDNLTVCVNSECDECERKRRLEGLYKVGETTIIISGYIVNVHDRQAFERHLLKNFTDSGLDYLHSLRGAYIIVVTDGRTLHLIRDGAGIKTVYYGKTPKRLLFASEPKGILCDTAFRREISKPSLAKYLTFSFVPGRDTMLKHLYELESGHYVSFEGGKETHTRWFIFEQDDKPTKTDEKEWLARFCDTFESAVEVRLPHHEPVGVFLSGGIDSSAVTAAVAGRHQGVVKTYAIHFGRKYANELEFARSVAERIKTDHEEVMIQPKDFLPNLRTIIWYMDDPVGDPVTVPNFELAGRASKDVRYVFNGEGGDPCFGGPKNIPMLLHHWYGGVERGPLFFEKKYLQSFQRMYSELDSIFTDDWRKGFSVDDDLASVITPYFKADYPRAFLDKLQVANMRLKASHLIYPKVERMTGAWGVTPLSPLTDERLMRLGLQMPSNLKLNHGVEKYILKKAFENRLPQAVIKRPKSGMRVPVRFWFQGEMKSYTKKILSKKRILDAGIFNYSRIKQILDYNKEEGKGRYGLQLWMLITFEIWRKIIVEGEAV